MQQGARAWDYDQRGHKYAHLSTGRRRDMARAPVGCKAAERWGKYQCLSSQNSTGNKEEFEDTLHVNLCWIFFSFCLAALSTVFNPIYALAVEPVWAALYGLLSLPASSAVTGAGQEKRLLRLRRNCSQHSGDFPR